MTSKSFVESFYGEAKKAEQETGISAIAILAQAALESGWGKYAPGNMFFGVKDTDGINGNEQLVTTTEYSRRADLKFPVIINVTPTMYGGKPGFKYRIKDYFRKYNSPSESFADHGKFFLSNPRYAAALKVKSDPIKFIQEVAKAGYATDPNYAKLLTSIISTIKKYA